MFLHHSPIVAEVVKPLGGNNERKGEVHGLWLLSDPTDTKFGVSRGSGFLQKNRDSALHWDGRDDGTKFMARAAAVQTVLQQAELLALDQAA